MKSAPKSLSIPPHLDEKEVLAIIDKIGRRLARQYKFGYMSEEDIRQEAFILGIEALQNYDGVRPLHNFLSIHIRNRLYNFKRKHYCRLETPCVMCPLAAYLPPDGCSAYDDKMDCRYYANWFNTNTMRRNLSAALEYDQVDCTNESSMKYENAAFDNIDDRELIEYFQQNVSHEQRKNLLIYLEGGKLGPVQLKNLFAHLQELIDERRSKARQA